MTFSSSPLSTLSILLLGLSCSVTISPSFAQQFVRTELDFSQAEEDPVTGQLCVLQQVCLSNPEALAKRLPMEPCPDANPFPPGCNCNEDSDCGGGTARCVACVCQDCPVSAQTSTDVINPPLTFVVDTTKSVKPDKYSIFNLTQKVVDRIIETDANIPNYQLVTFNDFGPDIRQNVDVHQGTPDVFQFKQEIISLEFESYDGGRDSKERLMQGLLAALESTPDKSLVVVFTDNGSKDLNLAGEIIRVKELKQIEVYIVLTPIYEGFPNDPSLDAYAEVADQVFDITDVGADIFLTTVETFEESNCV